MRRFFLALVALLAAASSAHAASVTLQFDRASYEIYDSGTLTITATADSGETDNYVYGELLFSGAGLLNPVVTQTPLESLGGSLPWLVGSSPCETTVATGAATSCVVINQIVGFLDTYPVTNTPLVIATVTFTVQPAGLDYFIDVSWRQDDFHFFGASEPAGACATVFAMDVPGAIGCPIPEPASGALLAFGLLGFGAARHRRRA